MMIRNLTILLVFVAVIAGFSAACSAPADTTGLPSGSFININPHEAYTLIRKNEDEANFIILDVRTPEEFRQGHIAGAVNINVQSVAFVEEISVLDRAATYLVYCRTANRSLTASNIMVQQGFTGFYHMTGGIVQWQSFSYPVVN